MNVKHMKQSTKSPLANILLNKNYVSFSLLALSKIRKANKIHLWLLLGVGRSLEHYCMGTYKPEDFLCVVSPAAPLQRTYYLKIIPHWQIETWFKAAFRDLGSVSLDLTYLRWKIFKKNS